MLPRPSERSTMGKKGPRQIEFVCCALVDGRSVSKSIEVDSSEEAICLFQKEFNVEPENIHGPYYRKRAGVLDNSREIEFSGERIKAIYRDWVVIASILKHPKNSAYLLFDKRVDGKKAPKPSGTFIIKMEEIKEIK